jgi:hypothetical protein
VSQTGPECVILDGRDSAVAAVRDALAARRPLVDYGKAHRGLGHPPPPVHTPISQRGDALDIHERDMTMRAPAGATLGHVQRHLAAVGQFLPIDADETLTLGEIVMHNVYGPLRLTYGTMRDLLLGLDYVDGTGRDIRVGGRTVKNVAGYDVTKLMVGSLGELGLVYAMTLRTYALPPQVMAVDLHVEHASDLDDRMTALLTCDARPTWLMLGRHENAWRMRLAYAGGSTACAAQLRSLETFLDALPGVRILTAATYEHEADALRRSSLCRWRDTAAAVLKLIVPPARTGDICAALTQAHQLAHLGARLHVDALPVHGCICVGGDLSCEEARQLDALAVRLFEQSGADQGLRIWHTRPPAAADLPPFGPPQPDYPLLQQLKAAMDPHSLFNPGRCIRPLASPNPQSTEAAT